MNIKKMIEQNAAERLKKALGFLETGWIQGDYAKDEDGIYCQSTCTRAACWCATGAMKAAGCTPRDFDRVAACLGGIQRFNTIEGVIINFNDTPGRTKREVISLFRVVIRRHDKSLPIRSAA